MIARVVDGHVPARMPLELVVAVAAIVLSIGVGLSIVSRPAVAYLPLAALGGALLLVNGRARVLFVIFGGFFVFQRAGGLDGTKLAFLGGATVALAGAFLNVRSLRTTQAYRMTRPLLGVSVAFFALAALSLPVANANGIPMTDWLRDVSPYVLFACAPIFALDARASFSRSGLVKVLVVAGTVGAAAFAIAWMNRRGIAYLPLSQFALASLFVPAALFAYAMSATLEGRRRRPRWLLLAAFLLALLLATGTRTSLALFAAPVAVALGARQHLAARSFRLALLGPVALGLTLALTVAVISASGGDAERLTERVSVLRSSGDSSEDASYNDRVEQTIAAWRAFVSEPVFGTGPGTLFEWRQQGLPGTRMDPVLDTPLTFLAKFGLLGVIALVVAVVAFSSFVANLARGRPPTVARLAVVGFLAVVGALFLFAPPFEDKGFAFALILVLALALAEFSARSDGPSRSAPATATPR